MTSLKLSYRRGVPAALLLGLIVGAPDIAQAVVQLPGIPPSSRPDSPVGPYLGQDGRPLPPPRSSSLPQTNKPLPPVNKPLPPRPASALPTPAKGILKAPNGRGAQVPPSERPSSPSSTTNQTVEAPTRTSSPSSSIQTRSVGTQTDTAAARAAAKAGAKSGIGGASRIISTEGGPEGSESEGDSPLAR
jgi:hypothetical protein